MTISFIDFYIVLSYFIIKEVSSLKLKVNLRKIRHEKHITQKQLARLTGLSQNYISEIENGVKRPSLDTIEIIATALNINPFDKLLEVIK